MFREFEKVYLTGSRSELFNFIRINPYCLLVDIYGSKLIHHAAEFGDYELVHYILSIDKDLVNVLDNCNQNALICAAAKGHDKIFELLLNCGSDYNVATNCPGVFGHGYNALSWALCNKKYSIVNILVNYLINDHNKYAIFSFLSNAEDALELIAINSKNAEFILGIPRLKELIQTTYNIDHIDSKKYSYTYRTRSARRPSFFLEVDKETGQFDLFKNTTRMLGEGSYGRVFEFKSESTNLSRAVKYSNPYWQLKLADSQDEIDSCINECIHRDMVYPGSNACLPIIYEQVNAATLQTFSYYSIRDIMNFVAGDTVDDYCDTISTTKEIAELFLAIAKELDSIHEKIIHNDVKSNNIIVSRENGELKARFIDFGFAVRTNASNALKFRKNKSSKCKHYAPEIFHFKRHYLPNPCQDVFSLGFMFAKIVRFIQFRGDCRDLDEHFPSIINFIRLSQNKRPSARPFLKEFIKELSTEYEIYSNSLSSQVTMSTSI